MENDRFYIGQVELGMIISRVIRHYRFMNKNADPDAVVIPYLSDVEGIKIEYEEGPKTVTKPKASKVSIPDSTDE